MMRSHRLSAHQHHGGLMDDCMSLTCYLAIDIYMRARYVYFQESLLGVQPQ